MRRWVVEGKKAQLKWYVRKHKGKVDLSQLRLDDKGRTALHLACKHQKHDVVTYLLRHQVDCLAQDSSGNVPLLVAAKAKKREKKVYYDIALALIEACVDALYVTNWRGQSANEWFKYLGLRKEKETAANWHNEDQLPNSMGGDDSWAQKLQDEYEFEYSQLWGNYEEDFCEDFASSARESYDAWADRITAEFRARKRYCSVHFSSPKPKYKRSRWSSTDQAEFERKAREDEERRAEKKKRKADDKLKRTKHKYEILCQCIFGGGSEEITLSLLPQASEHLISVLLSDIHGEAALIKSYLREQQIKWHPDKFVQKCGHRLCLHQRDAILDRVKQLSQIINGYLENI